MYAYTAVRWFGDASFCLSTAWTPNKAVAQGAASASFLFSFNTGNDGTRAPCPPDAIPVDPGDVVRSLAESFWATRVLAPPRLTTQPPFAVTGKPVFLQMSGDHDMRLAVPDPLGPEIVITAHTVTYEVDWGDAFADGADPLTSARTSTQSQGGPWPSGDVQHAYTHVADGVTISVTQRWSATWQAGPWSGSLPERRTTATLSGYPVRQLQAVRNR